MIAHLRGTVLTKAPNHAVVECSGVGYEVSISVATFTDLPAEGAEVALHVYTNVREDQIALFGFSDLQEKRLFERLIGVSGIGPKLAITVLSGISSERLVGAIRGNDLAMLTKIPGIGKKTAERVVLELKDKLDDLAAVFVSGTTGMVAPTPLRFGVAGEDALSALVNLGYPRPTALKAVETVLEKHPELARDFEALFRAAMGTVR
ncbi:Holliday junction branch migration protein RuvA [Granulicella sp. dw_53]|uniref:Holliday junction branch migration protein RuvA n=1 Tax=Granulicella sp. dw_53 TaxID=2719792 RepID=UPI001BD5C26F|nr:Holliday junction branch migration protein RuvA [Granulicella sp. dw_53]